MSKRQRYRGGKYVPIEQQPKQCPECLDMFVPDRANRVVCYKEECWRQRKRRQWAEGVKRQQDRRKGLTAQQNKVREYTKTSVMLIVSGLMRGDTLDEIAEALDRDIENLRSYVEQIETDGTAEKVRKRLRDFEEINASRGRI